jgi:hypothetical protein
MRIGFGFLRGYGRLIIGGIVIVVLYNTYAYGTDVTSWLQEQPVDGMMSASRKTPVPPDLSNLPLLVGNPDPQKKDTGQVETPLDLDAAFTPPIVEKKEGATAATGTPDYLALLSQELTITAVTNEGVFVSGRYCGTHYVAFGKPIDGCEYPGKGGGLITPVLVSVNHQGIVIREPGTNRTVKVAF